MSRVLASARKVVLDKRRPCWHCSRQLMMVKTEEVRANGRTVYKCVGWAVEEDGFVRLYHRQCLEMPSAPD